MTRAERTAVFAILVALAAAAPFDAGAEVSLRASPPPDPAAATRVPLELAEPQLGRPLSHGAPARVVRPRSVLVTGAAFLAGDLLAAGIVAGGSEWARHSGEEYLGVAVLTFEAAALVTVAGTPILGTLVAARGPAAAGSLDGAVVGGLVHLAGLAAAAVLVRRDQRWAAGGLLLAVDLGLAPWLVVRSIRRASANLGPDAPQAYAHPFDAPTSSSR